MTKRRRVARWLPWAALGLALGAALVIGAHRSAPPAPLAVQVRHIAQGIRCPTCQGETAADSQVYAAKAIRADIAQRLRSGQTPGQIRAYLVSRYGAGILESPPASGLAVVLWVLPAVAVAIAAGGLGVWLRRTGSRSAPEVSDHDRALVAAALAQDNSPVTSTPDDPGAGVARGEPVADAPGQSRGEDGEKASVGRSPKGPAGTAPDWRAGG